jgi:hypothetical protein
MASTAKTGTRIKKYTTIEELENSTIGPIYVLNETAGETEGRIIINIPKTNGNGNDLLRIAKTFIPIDVSMQVQRMQVLGSSEFRKAVNKGLIKLVSKEYAQLLLDQPDAKEEAKRVIADENKAKAILQKAGVVQEKEDDEDDGYIDTADIKSDLRKKSDKKKTESKAKPSPKVETIAITAKNNGSKGVEIVAKLKNVRTMTTADLSFLSKEFSEKPVVIKYLRTRLEELRAEA